MAQGQVQQFASQPMPVGARKYRPDETGPGNNMMHDKRVVRGNTHASMVQTQPDAAEVRKQREAQRRRLMRANQPKKRAGTPEPVVGRKHMDIQTDSYLEELTERTVEFEAETQTDINLDRPVSPLFMPAKIGVDIETQIEDGELFDFDVECEPVLEVLVGKTLEQSMMEVLEEEELESLHRHQEDFEKKRNTELLEVQRMEAAEKRRHDEMERRMQQQAAQREQDLSVMRKVVSRSIAASHLSSLKDRALSHLLDAGCFADSVQIAVDNNFMPSLFASITQQMQEATRDRALVADTLQSTVSNRLAAHDKVLEVERRRRETIDQAVREARKEKDAQKQARVDEQKLIQEAQEKLLEWEAIVEEPPQVEDRFVLQSLNEQNQVVFAKNGEDKVAEVPEAMLEELKQQFEKVQQTAKEKADEAEAKGEGLDVVYPHPELVLGKIESKALDDGGEAFTLANAWVGTEAELAPPPAEGAQENPEGEPQ